MATVKEIVVPDIGGAENVDVIELLVKPGDKIAKDASLVTLESDKASMEIPSPYAGTVKEMKVKVGDKVSQNSVILMLETADANATSAPSKPAAQSAPAQTSDKSETAQQVAEVRVPDIGGAENVDVIEVLVKPGDKVNKDASLITLESEKASMEIPSPYAGTVKDIKVKVGDKVSQNSLILTLLSSDAVAKPETKTAETAPTAKPASAPSQPVESAKTPAINSVDIHAGPAVRRIAREFGVDLSLVRASGEKGRILKEDVQAFVKAELAKAKSGGIGGLQVAAAPVIDFSKFGEIETKPLNKIKRLTGVNVHRSWVTIPHVTQFAEADITELEAFREQEKQTAEKQGYKLTPLVFIMKAVVAALKAYPQFNASLDGTGENLIMKKYFHIGVAVDTPNGLVVPVVRDVDQKGLEQLAKELATISKKAREKGLMPNDMQGGCFTISSLGGIGGTAFTPIVNAPEVAILGVSKASMKPVYQHDNFVPRLMLPLSLSYDHRVIDGADGARFIVYLSERLTDIRTLLL